MTPILVYKQIVSKKSLPIFNLIKYTYEQFYPIKLLYLSTINTDHIYY